METTHWEKYATVEGFCEGVPIYSLGHITYIYGVSPEFVPGTVIQEGNLNTHKKILPKKSWEMEGNPFGVNICEPGPRTPWNDSQPMLPIHLIDGDPFTAWSSHGCSVPDERPEWIRIDLAVETEVESVALVCCPDFARGDLYREGMLLDRQGYHEWSACALPGEITIQVSRDAWHWETVYGEKNFCGDERGKTLISFPAKTVKQIIVTGNNFKRKLSKYDGYCFSIGSLEVHDRQGSNMALVSKGAGVTVSSTGYLMDHDRYTQELIFGPVQYDLGLKWLRCGADNGLLTWNCVEREQGVFKIDKEAERWIKDIHENGVNIIMNLDVKANWIYRGEKFGDTSDPSKYVHGHLKNGNFMYRGEKPDWRTARIYEMNNIYYDFPGWAFETEFMFEKYMLYIDFMTQKFKGMVAYYEVGNEWGGNREIFVKAVRRIKQNDPDAKIMVCVAVMQEFPHILKKLSEEYPDEMDRLMPDAVGSHPGTRVDAGLTLDDLDNFYWQINETAMAEARALGYRGVFIASEVYNWSRYAPGPFELDPERPGISKKYSVERDAPAFCGESETVRAKYVAQNFIGHAGLGMMALQCNTFFVSGGANGQGFFRVPVPSQVINPIQPDMGYYVMRTVCTALDGWLCQPFEGWHGQPLCGLHNKPLGFRIDCSKRVQHFTFARCGSHGAPQNSRMIAVWLPGDTGDAVKKERADIFIEIEEAKNILAADILNGFEQELTAKKINGGLLLEGILIKDYPTLIKFDLPIN
ncbi:MAG: discoidin domain-containing protein [Defluviitaleaceae bacterium]|nr:discoidin domain-containing protein [Defluviitaleaceae bacterium]